MDPDLSGIVVDLSDQPYIQLSLTDGRIALVIPEQGFKEVPLPGPRETLGEFLEREIRCFCGPDGKFDRSVAGSDNEYEEDRALLLAIRSDLEVALGLVNRILAN